MCDFSSNNHASTTVHFNVGGTHYEVALSLLNQYPDTMLARMTSDTWLNETDEIDANANDDNGNRINGRILFIERDGERFKYCLDYMRDDGVVTLPPRIPKKSLLKDLDYYGFEEVDPSKITEDGLLAICLDNINSHLGNVKKELGDFDEELALLNYSRECLLIIRNSEEGLNGLKTIDSLLYKKKRQRHGLNMKRKCLELAKVCLLNYRNTTKLMTNFRNQSDGSYYSSAGIDKDLISIANHICRKHMFGKKKYELYFNTILKSTGLKLKKVEWLAKGRLSTELFNIYLEYLE